jgi:hypothetical protein
MLFLLYGTLHLEWERTPQDRFNLNVALDFSIPDLSKKQPDKAEWQTMIPLAVNDVFCKTLPGSNALNGALAARAATEPSVEFPCDISMHKLAYRLKHLIHVQSHQTDFLSRPVAIASPKSRNPNTQFR